MQKERGLTGFNLERWKVAYDGQSRAIENRNERIKGDS